MNHSLTHSNTLNKIGACASIGMALCYLSLFVIYGGLLNPPVDGSVTDKIAYLLAQHTLIKSTYLIGYIVFAGLLCLTTQALLQTYRADAPQVMDSASLFALFWALVLLCTGMIGITGLGQLGALQTTDPDGAAQLYRSIALLEESLGGGIELLGGVWVLLLGVAGWRGGLFSRSFSLFSLLKGSIGVATVVSSESILRDLFGLSGIVWFVWLGIVLWPESPESGAPRNV